MQNMEETNAYKRLVFRRDLNRVVLDIRAYLELTKSPKSGVQHCEHLRSQVQYARYMGKYGRFQERIMELLDRAKEIGINPNDLDTNADKLEVLSLYKTATPEEKEQLDDLTRETDKIREILCYPMRLSTELIELHEKTSAFSPLSFAQIESILVILFDGYVKRELNSKEYIFLLGFDEEEPWLESCFESYFIDESLPLESKQVDFARIYDAGYLEENDRMKKNFKKFLEFYLANGCRLDDTQFINMVELEEFEDIIEFLANHKDALPMDVCEYIDKLLGEKMGLPHINHDISSPFFVHKMETEEEAKDFGKNLATILPTLLRLKSESTTDKEVVSYLGEGVASLNYALEIATAISNDLDTQSLAAEMAGKVVEYVHYESLKSAFDDGYVKAATELKSRQMNMTPVNPQ